MAAQVFNANNLEVIEQLNIAADEFLATAAGDPNLKGCDTIEGLQSRLKELSAELSKSDHRNSPFCEMKFEGTNPNPLFVPNAFKPSKGQDGNPIQSYHRYAVKDEALITKALSVKKPVKKPVERRSVVPALTTGAAAQAPSSPASPSSPSTKRGFQRRKSTSELLELVRNCDPDLRVVDLSGDALVQMKSDEKISELCDAIGPLSPVTTLLLKDCNIGPVGARSLSSLLAANTAISTLDLADNKALKEEGAVALAEGLANNTGVTELNLMGMLGAAVKSEVACSAFIKMYESNFSLKKIIWRLDHPLAHQLARLATRNNSIARRISQNKPFEDLLPDDKKGKGVVVHGVRSDGALLP